MKTTMKVIGKVMGVYAILNTLVWAFTGVGRYLNDCYRDLGPDGFKDYTFMDVMRYSYDKMSDGFEKSNKGYKMWLQRTFGRG